MPCSVVVVVVVVSVWVPPPTTAPGDGRPPGSLPGFGTLICGSCGRFTPGRFGSGTRVLTRKGVGTPTVTVVCCPLKLTTWLGGSSFTAAALMTSLTSAPLAVVMRYV